MPEERKFIGRERELEDLKGLLDTRVASLLVIKGRRRIGKSRLVKEFVRTFANKVPFYSFAGLAPEEGMGSYHQKEEFANTLSKYCDLPGIKAENWSDLFYILGKQIADKSAVILLDEISWMADGEDPTFLSKLKAAWDEHFSQNPKLVLVLCGSISSWIEKNILSGTGFLGRVTLNLTLDELSLKESSELLSQLGFKGSSYEKLTYLALTGGVPRYLELYNPKQSALKNIQNLCFKDSGILVKEFKHIFYDLFGKRGDIYEKIIKALLGSSLEYSEIAHAINYTSSGTLSAYLEDLIQSGFVSKDSNWSFKSHKILRLCKYRLKDNYVRFYLRYIEPNLYRIQKKQFENFSISTLKQWDSVLALQFENLVLANRSLIINILNIAHEDIKMDNPYFQRATKQQKGCQIDYLIETKFKTLYLCEVRFKNKIEKSVIDEIKTKIKALKIPRSYAIYPVLIYYGELCDSVLEEDFFYQTINFADLL